MVLDLILGQLIFQNWTFNFTQKQINEHETYKSSIQRRHPTFSTIANAASKNIGTGFGTLGNILDSKEFDFLISALDPLSLVWGDNYA